MVYPALVQGAGAKESIVKAIEYFNEAMSVDTLIVGRGGGSIEDLWAFNEECVARAIFASRIPIISAVGHETDTTIADYVADLRAPTPSAAAEESVPSSIELSRLLILTQNRMLTSLQNRINSQRIHLKRLRIRDPKDKINELSQKLDNRVNRMENAYKLTLSGKGKKLGELCGKLDALSPLRTLSRGYSIPVKEDGSVLRSTEEFSPGMEFDLKLRDGDVRCITKG